MDRYEAYMLRQYFLSAILGGATLRSRASKRCSEGLAEWLAQYSESMGAKANDADLERYEIGSTTRVNREHWQQIAPQIVKLQRISAVPRFSPLEKRLNWLSNALSLNEIETPILKFLTRVALDDATYMLSKASCGMSAFSLALESERETKFDAIAAMTGINTSTVRKTLGRNHPLIIMGLVEDRGGGDYAVSGTVLTIARLDSTDSEMLHASLLGSPKAAELGWTDFEHLGANRDLAGKLLVSALTHKKGGTNVLLYGPPGTGKTEFARTLADHLDANAVFVGEVNDEHGEPSRASRIASFVLLNAIGSRAGRTILVVDEADDIFTGVDEDDRGSRTGSKVFMNRLLENNETPTIWITNNPERLGGAVIRRMSMAFRFPLPTQKNRQRMISKIAEKQAIDLPIENLASLARMSAPPAILNAALRSASMIGGDAGIKSSHGLARGLLEAMGGERRDADADLHSAFDPSLSHADIDLTDLTARIISSSQMRFSMCLHGVAGTGKSAYARYVAGQLGLEVMHRRASDLLGMFVGQSEKRIAAAFQEAADQRAMLIIDEADSLLRDRGGARHSWEVSQVNEMLTWMECHPYPFICTTNLMDSLDPATLRRFLFKVKFLPMTPAQISRHFVTLFGCEAPASVLRLDHVAPGDLEVVARKAKVLGIDKSSELARLIAHEIAHKPEARKLKIGF